MPKVLTTDSTINCPNAGTLTFPGVTHKLTVQGKPVLVQSDMTNPVLTKIIGCSLTPTPCIQVNSISAGQSSKLTVDGGKVLLDTLMGLTNTSGNLTVKSISVQSKLTAI